MNNLGIFIAVYGAILSTVLAVSEALRHRRKILIFVDHIYILERVQMSITNGGTRPITIVGMGIDLNGENLWTSTLANGQEYPFPITLTDGKSVSMYLSDMIMDTFHDPDSVLLITIYDAEGNEYTKFKKRRYDTKAGKYF